MKFSSYSAALTHKSTNKQAGHAPVRDQVLNFLDVQETCMVAWNEPNTEFEPDMACFVMLGRFWKSSSQKLLSLQRGVL